MIEIMTKPHIFLTSGSWNVETVIAGKQHRAGHCTLRAARAYARHLSEAAARTLAEL